MIIANDKYNMTEINSSYYSVQMRLTIRNFRKSDFGGYKCISKNSIGDAEGNIRLYGKFFHFGIFLHISSLWLNTWKHLTRLWSHSCVTLEGLARRECVCMC